MNRGVNKGEGCETQAGGAALGRADGWLFQVNASKSPRRHENPSGLRVFFPAGSICSQEMRFLLKCFDMHVQRSPPSPPQPPDSLQGSPRCGHFVLAHAVAVKLEALFPGFRPLSFHRLAHVLKIQDDAFT